MLLKTNLLKTNYNIIIYQSRVEEISKNIKKKQKIFIKINKNIYLKITIKKIE